MNYLFEFKTFQDKHELNHHVKRHLEATYDDINATDRQVFKFIARYAVKYAGASHLKVSTIADYIERTDRATRNILAKLERLDMIKRITRNRPKSGGRGANIIVILPFKEDNISEDNSENISDQSSESTSEQIDNDKPTDAKEQTNKSENEPLRNLSKKHTYVLATADDKPRALRQSIPEVVYEALSPYFDAEGLYKTYGILLRAKAMVNRNITLEEFGSEYIDVFLNVVRSRKLGKIRRNFDGLLYVAWSRLSHEIGRRINARGNDNMRLFAELIGES